MLASIMFSLVGYVSRDNMLGHAHDRRHAYLAEKACLISFLISQDSHRDVQTRTATSTTSPEEITSGLQTGSSMFP